MQCRSTQPRPWPRQCLFTIHEHFNINRDFCHTNHFLWVIHLSQNQIITVSQSPPQYRTQFLLNKQCSFSLKILNFAQVVLLTTTKCQTIIIFIPYQSTYEDYSYLLYKKLVEGRFRTIHLVGWWAGGWRRWANLILVMMSNWTTVSGNYNFLTKLTDCAGQITNHW